MTDRPGSLLRITVSTAADAVTLTLGGEFDLDGAAYFWSCADDVLDRNSTSVVLDLADLSFIDSTGVAALLELHRRLGQGGRTLRLINVGAQPASVFDVTGVTGSGLAIAKAATEPP